MVAIDRRVGLIFVAFLSLLAVAVVRAVYLGVVRADTLQQAAVSQQITNVPIPATRGAITDRNGVQLALSESAADVIADPYLIRRAQPMVMAQTMAPLLHMPVLKVLTAITKPHTGYVVVAHEVTPATAQAILALKFGGKPINGVTSIPDVKRVYPRDWTAAQILGGVYSSGAGDAGLEYQYNSVLSGTAGERRIVNDAIHQPISIDEVRPMQSGRTLQLTLDSGLQNEVEQVLAGVGEQYQPRAATAIAMNPDTGAILALANWPRVNANDPNAVRSRRRSGPCCGGQLRAGLDVQGDHGLRGPPGRRGHAEYPVQHPAHAPGRRSPDLRRRDPRLGDAHHRSDPQGLQQHRRGPDRDAPRRQPLQLLGAQVRLRLDHRLRPPGRADRDRAPAVPVLGLVDGQSADGAGGVGDADPDGHRVFGDRQRRDPAFAPHRRGDRRQGPALPAGHRIISASTAASVRDMLRGVLADGGTASGAAIPGFDLAGKTGTANVVVDGKYSSSEYIASFIGMVPASDPKLVVAVMVDEPQGSIYGGSVAAPAFQKIVGWAVPHFGISPR